MAFVTVLQHHDEDDPGLIGEAFVARGHDLRVVRVETALDLPSLDGADVLLVLGSKEAVYDPEALRRFAAAELDLLREADARGIAIFAICFGAQELCVLAGGSVARAEHAEIGWHDVAVVGDERLRGPWFEFHFDVCTLPDSVELLASTDLAPQAFWWGRHLATQFHPEIDDRQLTNWFAAGDDVRAFGLDAATMLAETATLTPAARKRAAGLVAMFCEKNGLA